MLGADPVPQAEESLAPRRPVTSPPAEDRRAAAEPSAAVAVALCAGCVAIGAALRALPLGNDFWLDEIWTWLAARRLSSASEVFTAIRHSNNHHLNTLLFYWLGERESWVTYRIPSLLAGVGTVALAAAIAWRRGRLEAVFAALLTASSFALIHFSSEARGYALAVFLALVAHWALQRHLARPRGATAALFAASVALGVLSHLVALFFWAGAVAQSTWRLAVRGRRGATAAARELLRLHLLPFGVLLGLYALDLRHMVVGRGTPASLDEVLARTAGYALGLPVDRDLALPYAALASALLALGLRIRWRERDDEGISFAVCILLAPVSALLAFDPEVVAVRYFLIGITLLLLLASDLLARAVRGGTGARALALALLALFVAGNARHTAAFFERGRGGYGDAVRLMARATPAPRIRVGSDQDLRNGMTLEFYRRVLPAGKQIAYYRRGSWPSGGPDWVIHHAPRRPDPPRPAFFDEAGNRYELVAEFDHAAISGFWWGVYRNASLGPAAGAARGGSPRRRITRPTPRPRNGSAPMRPTRV